MQINEINSLERTRNYLKQIKGAILYRVIAMAASFLAIPLMIKYLGVEQFGVWSTLLAVMSWVVFFDLGIGNGLRNRIAESLAKNNTYEASKYIDSGYTVIGIIVLILWILITVASYFLSWQFIFNTKVVSESTLRVTVQIVGFFILFNFWVGLITAILGAVQKTSIVALGQVISNSIALVVVYILGKITTPSVSYLAIAYGSSLVLSNAILSLWFYRKNLNFLPKFYINRRHITPLLSVGLNFFVIQLAVLVIFTTDKVMIAQFFGPSSVAEYEVLFRVFSIISFAHGLISAPLWSAYTEAYFRGDFKWIKNMLKKQLVLFLTITGCAVILIFSAKKIIELWVGQDVVISQSLTIAMGLLAVLSMWNNIFGFLLGGIGKVRLGAIYTAVTAALNIPVSYYFAIQLNLGLSGIVYGTVASIAISAIVSPIQVYFFIFSAKKNDLLYSILR